MFLCLFDIKPVPVSYSFLFLPLLQKGLRTLVVACRHFNVEEYEEVDRRLHEARAALQQREERLAEVFSFIEKDLELLGATGVEDKYVNNTVVYVWSWVSSL